MTLEFYNEPALDFTLPENLKQLADAYSIVDQKKGSALPFVIDGVRKYTPQTKSSVNPAKKEEVIAKMSLANTEQADAAIHSCDRAFKLWRKTSIDYRIEKILELSKLIKKNRFELIAWMTEENGKNWGEADVKFVNF